jgi:GxxExxY protein
VAVAWIDEYLYRSLRMSDEQGSAGKCKHQNTDEVVRKIIGAAYEVSNQLGSGFLEKVYEKALVVELEERKVKVRSQVPLSISYKNRSVGDYIVDLLVEEQILVELKCVDKLGKVHMAQCINYLSATGLKLCLLINFQNPKVEWKRIVRDY